MPLESLFFGLVNGEAIVVRRHTWVGLRDRRASIIGVFLLTCCLFTSACWTTAIAQPPLASDSGTLAGGGEANAVGAGGGAMADFDSLMNLVQTTIEPDTWEALGGVGTMAPYPAGIVVDPDGLIRQTVAVNLESTPEDRSRDLAAMIGVEPIETAGSWRDAAAIRCVSVRRLLQTLTTQTTNTAFPIDDMAIDRLAGLSEIRMMLLTPDDLILAGTVGGFQDVDGWDVDRKTGLPPMRLSSLAIGLSASRHQTPFGCTIDPRTAGLQNAARTTAQVVAGDLPIGRAADSLAESLGRQDVRVFGTAADHEVSWLMIEADRHMKRLALGLDEMPDGTRTFPQTVQSDSPTSPPSDLLLRLWFTGQPLSVRQSKVESSIVLQLAGMPLQLSGDNEVAVASGERGHHVVDPTTQTFVDQFNRHFSTIRSRYPLYGALQSVYQAAAVAELWTRSTDASDHEILQRGLMHFASQRAAQLPTPREVDSIAILHRYRHRNQMHHLVLASGGVEVKPESLVSRIESYPSLNDYQTLKDQRPADRWWWNAKR